MHPMHEAEYCSFCGKHRDEVAKLVSGPAKVGICNECHDTMRAMMPEPPPPRSQEDLDRDWDEFQRVLDNPPKANEALRDLMRK